MVGQHISKYRVTEQIGRGGMGTVYRAIDETLHREVAIKVLNAELNDPSVARRFRAEAVTVARLNHPGIATIYELVQHEGQWLMVMEFLRGETLEHLCARKGALPVEQAADICMQTLAALAHAHGLALVVHTREAWDDTFDILEAEGVPERTVIHCFTGGPDEARRCLDLGAHLSFSGVITFKGAPEVREAVALCPLDRLLVETDSSFLAPVPHRGRPNQPAFVPLVGETVAEVKQAQLAAVAEATWANAARVYGLPD